VLAFSQLEEEGFMMMMMMMMMAVMEMINMIMGIYHNTNKTQIDLRFLGL